MKQLLPERARDRMPRSFWRLWRHALSCAVLVSIATLPTSPAQSRRASGDYDHTALGRTPSWLEDDLADSLAALEAYREAAARLDEAVRVELPASTGGRSFVPSPASPNGQLLLYMYPWARAAAVPNVPPPPKATDVAAELALANVKPLLPTKAYTAATLAVQRWQDLRRGACRLTAKYARGQPGAEGKSAPSPEDPSCAADFDAALRGWSESVVQVHRAMQAELATPLPKFDPAGAKLHYLAIPDGYEREANTEVRVSITDTSAPLIIMLHSSYAKRWKLHLAPGVRIRQVVVLASSEQTVSFTPASAVPVNIYTQARGNTRIIWGFLNRTESSRLDLRDALNRMLGLAPSTMQFSCPAFDCAIDGRASWRPRIPKIDTREPVTWEHPRLIPRDVRRLNGNVETDSGGAFHFSSPRVSGRLYFELQVEALAQPDQVFTSPFVGLADISDGTTDPYSWNDDVRVGIPIQLKPGSTLNVALDLDSARLYFGVDGKWRNDPSTGADGIALKPGRVYMPILAFPPRSNVATSAGVPLSRVNAGTWRGRFTPEDFAYPPPAGYAPYQAAP